MDVTVVVATFGEHSWVDLANERAIPSAAALDVPVVHVHRDTLHEARNIGLDAVTTHWVCHLDADDELEPGYFDAMERGTADLRAPAVRYVLARREADPKVLEGPGMADGNHLVVGTLARADMLRAVGGWRDWPFYEDWDLWQRSWLIGATIETIPDAVYRAHVRRGSRNRAPSRRRQEEVHHAIRRANMPWLYADQVITA